MGSNPCSRMASTSPVPSSFRLCDPRHTPLTMRLYSTNRSMQLRGMSQPSARNVFHSATALKQTNSASGFVKGFSWGLSKNISTLRLLRSS